MKTTGFLKTGLLALAVLAASCQKTMEVKVHASFTTDKDVYEVYEPVVITNTTVVENAQIAICEWNLGEGKTSYDFNPENVSFSTPGDYTISLTVTSDAGSVKGTFEKKISVVDNNIKPVADFSWEPQEIVAGEPVVFTDNSTDEDGTIMQREWTFGTTVVEADGKDIEYTFVSYGQVDVTLTVTDDKKGTASKTVTVEVAKGANHLELLWEKAYDDTEDAYVFGTSPAVSPDGQSIYVSSTGYHLVSFDTEGKENWRFDIGKDGASAMGNDGSIRHQSPTPSVDENGVVYIASSFDEPKAAKGALYAVYDNGSQKWYVDLGSGTSSRFMSPCLTDKYVIISNRNCSKWNKWQVQVFERESGAFVTDMHANAGSYGGILAMSDGKIICGTGGKWGYRLYYPDGEGAWKFGPDNKTGSNNYNLGTQDTPNGAQPAMSEDGKVYLLLDNTAGTVSGGGILYCFDSGSFTAFDELSEPEWTVGIRGDVPQSGLGCVLGESGTVYVTTASGNGEKAYVTAVSPSGTVLWESAADGNINGVAAVDSDGCVYYNDSALGKLVRLSGADGSRVAEIELCDEMRTSPAIAADGTVYVNGMKDGKPVLFAVQGQSSGHADSWSQLGGNPQRTGYMY